MRKLLIATTNPGKFWEYQESFKRLKIPLKLVSLKDLGIKEKVEENGRTFKENAIKKAEFYSQLIGLPTLADDSGLEVDYLNGEPGVRSRRWPGYDASDQELIDLVIRKLKNIPPKKRGARMKAVLALAIPRRRTHTFEGIIRGTILEEPLKKIIPGFPFRSLFRVSPKIGMLGERESHRKRALKKAAPLIRKLLC